MLLGDRLRSEEERDVVKEVIELHCLKGKHVLNLEKVYTENRQVLEIYLRERDIKMALELQQTTQSMIENDKETKQNQKNKKEDDNSMNIDEDDNDNDHNDDATDTEAIVLIEATQKNDTMARSVGRVSLTNALARVFTLVQASVEMVEPVLLVGGTGCGKTTACQLLAERMNRPMYILNCHQHTETSDILGGLRPVRGRALSLSSFRTTVCELVDNVKSRNAPDR